MKYKCRNASCGKAIPKETVAHALQTGHEPAWCSPECRSAGNAKAYYEAHRAAIAKRRATRYAAKKKEISK